MVRRQQLDLTLANLLPPLFILLVVATIWSTYTFLHLLPLLQLGASPEILDKEARRTGERHCMVSQWITFLLVVSYTRAAASSPGLVPTSAEWLLGSAVGAEAGVPLTREVKNTTGERRRCKKCLTYKPDRCHHCRVCKCCILRMDHHCPWIMNCVGFRNHKFFFLLVVYSVMACVYMGFTVSFSVAKSTSEDIPSSMRFLLVLCLMLSIIMGLMLGVFLGFHTWLMFKGMTTIEFCEKSRVNPATIEERRKQYDVGLWENVHSVLGPRPMFWFLPLDPPEGDGLSFSGHGASAGLFTPASTGTWTPTTTARGSGQSPKRRPDADPEWTGGGGHRGGAGVGV